MLTKYTGQYSKANLESRHCLFSIIDLGLLDEALVLQTPVGILMEHFNSSAHYLVEHFNSSAHYLVTSLSFTIL